VDKTPCQASMRYTERVDSDLQDRLGRDTSLEHGGHKQSTGTKTIMLFTCVRRISR
jgi:hypothetical protein